VTLADLLLVSQSALRTAGPVAGVDPVNMLDLARGLITALLMTTGKKGPESRGVNDGIVSGTNLRQCNSHDILRKGACLGFDESGVQ